MALYQTPASDLTHESQQHGMPEVRVDSDVFEQAPEAQYYLGAPRTAAEALAARQLRAGVYIDEMGFLKPEDRDPDGGESDPDDYRSVHFMVMENMGPGEQPRVVGVSRLIIKRDENDPLPVERLFADTFRSNPAPAQAAEASRLIARHPDRQVQRGVNAALMRAMTVWAVENTRQPVYGVLEDPLLAILRRMNFPYQEAAPPQYLDDYQTVNRAIAIDPFGVLRFGEASGHLQTAQGQGFFQQKQAVANGGVGYLDRAFTPLSNAVVPRPTVAPMLPLSAALTERNRGFLSDREQAILGAAKVAIAGCGGDGGALAVQLARMGVGAQGGEIRLADPDTFELANINRQEGATLATVGRNKSQVIAEIIKSINPNISVTIYPAGITTENAGMFVEGANLLIDESEFTIHALGVALAREARQRHIPNLQVMNVGFGAQVTSYDVNGRYTLERRLGLRADMPLEEVAGRNIPLGRWLAKIPPYADGRAFDAVAEGAKPAPSVAPGVTMAASIASTQAIKHLLGGSNRRGKPVYAPHVLSIDAMTGTSELIRHPRRSLVISYLGMKWRTLWHRVPRVDY